MVSDNTYRAGKYGAVDLIWLPVSRLGLGIEYHYGERENKDGERGSPTASRWPCSTTSEGL